MREGERKIESGRRGLFLRATWHACRARTSTGVVTLLPAQLEARRKNELSQRVEEGSGSLAAGVWREEWPALGGEGRRISVTMVKNKYIRSRENQREPNWVGESSYSGKR